jgi:hypothetical protein
MRDEQFQSLVSLGSETGDVKHGAGLNSDVAVDQMTEVLSKMADPSNPLTPEEKTVVHDLISGFSKAFLPRQGAFDSLKNDFERIIDGFGAKSTNQDQLLGATNLLDMFGSAEKKDSGKVLAELTEKFLDAMEKNFAKVSGSQNR